MGLADLVAAYQRHRFAGLFASLLITLGAGATLDALVHRYNPLQLLLALNLLAAIASFAREGHVRVPLLLGGGFVVARVLQAALGAPAMLAVSEGLWIAAVLLAMVVAVRHAFGRAGSVDRERILAALDAYLLAGLLFGVAYWMLERTWPGSFVGTATSLPDLSHAIYFSFVTIATLGYGDVVPATPAARGLAMVEGVGGQLYLAVLVARLVSLYARERP